MEIAILGGAVVFLVLGAFVGVVMAGHILLFSIVPICYGAFYAGTRKDNLQELMVLAQTRSGEKAADLGSGDGRIVIALAKAGAMAHGYEINPLLVWWSRRKIRKAGLQNTAWIYWRNFWSIDFSPFDVVIVFGVSTIMKQLEEKLKKELKPGARVVSNSFAFPFWKPEKTVGRVFFYRN
ncbi:MAG: class I SAM-dependent methyltransferase [Candidatus Wildermuthbacteria bacterium]|nr:class I SAM-dependent methyltransferase [Candidatus Wildermuthbacteria bacterium]